MRFPAWRGAVVFVTVSPTLTAGTAPTARRHGHPSCQTPPLPPVRSLPHRPSRTWSACCVRLLSHQPAYREPTGEENQPAAGSAARSAVISAV